MILIHTREWDRRGHLGLDQVIREKYFNWYWKSCYFIMKRFKPYLETAMNFLTNRVSNSDVDDWDELIRILRFVQCNLKGKRAFGAVNLDKIFTWADASYAVNHDMKSHTGGAMSMVLGVTHCRSSKQKLNTKNLHNQGFPARVIMFHII